MNRSATLRLIAVGLALYAVYVASYVPAMLVGPPASGLLICFILQTICALAAALGLWRDCGWAAGAVMLLGASIAGTRLFEGFVLGIVAYLPALLVAAVALIVTWVIAAYVNRRSPIPPRQA